MFSTAGAYLDMLTITGEVSPPHKAQETSKFARFESICLKFSNLRWASPPDPPLFLLIIKKITFFLKRKNPSSLMKILNTPLFQSLIFVILCENHQQIIDKKMALKRTFQIPF